MKILLAGLCIISLTVSTTACTTFDAYTGEEKATNTSKGAGIGAGVAVVAAYLTNKNKSGSAKKKALLKAAGVGAIVGGGVGYYMDTQEAKLRQQLRNTGVGVQREGDNINLIMPGNITFPTNSSDLRADFFEVLNSVALVLAEYNKTTVVVAGFTDSTGNANYNQQLSEKRATAVASYMQSKGVVAARLDVVGFGEEHPVADNNTEAGRSMNRRVELSLMPITE